MTSLARATSVLTFGAALCALALAGCDKPAASGSPPAEAGAAPSEGDGAPTAADGGGAQVVPAKDGPTGSTELAGTATGTKADGAPCMTASECASGVCEGEGCGADQPGQCVPSSRMCTRDLRQYCGCDGVTFSASGSCPGARFSKREPC